MKTNVKRGLRRLAIALGVPWFGFWWVALALNTIAFRRADAPLAAAIAGHDIDTMNTWSSVQSQAASNIILAAACGIVLPLLALGVGLIARWVFRGFRQDTGQAGI